MLKFSITESLSPRVTGGLLLLLLLLYYNLAFFSFTLVIGLAFILGYAVAISLIEKVSLSPSLSLSQDSDNWEFMDSGGFIPPFCQWRRIMTGESTPLGGFCHSLGTDLLRRFPKAFTWENHLWSEMKASWSY